MALTTGIIFGLLVMLFWGIAKVLAKPAIDRMGAYTALFYEHIVVAVILIIFIVPSARLVMPSGRTLIQLLIAIVLGAVSIYLFFRAIEKGKVSLTTPIALSSTIITVILSYTFYHEILSPLQAFSVFLLIIGVIAISFRYSDIKRLHFSYKLIPGAEFALLTMLGWGLYFFLIKPIVVELGPIVSVLYLEVGISILISIPALLRGIKKPGRAGFYLLFSGISVAIGSLSFNLGLEKTAVSLLYPIANSAILVTVLASYLFLKERIELNQKMAIFLILIGIILISL